MKIMMKSLCLMLCLAMLLGALIACQEEDPIDAGTTDDDGAFGNGDSEPKLEPDPEPDYTEGLAYTLLPDGTYEVAQGDAGTESEISIPAAYGGIAVTRIAEHSFGGMYLTKVTIPDSITSIGRGAFTSSKLAENPDRWENGVLYIGKYLIAAKREIVSGEYTVKDGTRVIADSAFYSCLSLQKVTIPDSVVTIDASAFDQCKNLTEVTLGKGITKINENTFSSCENLTEIYIPDGVTRIDDGAFNSCKALKTVSVPNSVTSIGGGAFLNCYVLTRIVLPSSVTEIASYAFGNALNWIGFVGTEEQWNAIDLGDYAIPRSTTVSVNYNPNP